MMRTILGRIASARSFVFAAFALAMSAASAFDTPYLTFRSASSFSLSATKRWDGTLQKATGNPTDEASWSDWTGSSITAGLSDGQYYIYLRGKDNTTLNNSSYGALFSFSYGASVYCEGDIEALRDYEGNPPAMAPGCCKYMFSGCTALLSAPSLSATTLANECYFGMFERCSSLTAAPALPAMTMMTDCYRSMFDSCTSLKALPSLPATTTAQRCYFQMFSGCTSLEVNSATPGVEWSIPAQVGSLASSWNSSMFQDTSGSFTGDPQVETPYYVASALPFGEIYQIPGKGTLDLALVGFSVNVDLSSTVKNGTAPYTFAHVGGTLPPGVNVSGSTLSGTPTTAGNYSFSLSVTDSASHTLASAAYTMQVVQPTIVPTTFVSADGSPITTNCIALTTAMTTLNQAWYVASGTLSYGTGGIKVSGDVNLVLADGVSMTVQGASKKAGVNVAPGNSLTIYGQSEGTGVLNASGNSSDGFDFGGAGIGGNDKEDGGTVTINGGTITATGGGYCGAGIGGGKAGNGGTVTINGGTVTAQSVGSYAYAAGIGGGQNGSGGNVTINGGTVTATAGPQQTGTSSGATGIGRGCWGASVGTLTVGQAVSVKAGASANPTEEIGRGGVIVIGNQRYFFVENLGLTQIENAFSAYMNEPKAWDLVETLDGGTQPYTFALKSGSSLPTGLGLDGTTITGKVAVANTYTFTYEVTDSSATPLELDATYTLTVTAPDPITAATNLTATVGKAKSFNIAETISGGVPPYALAFSGTEPTGFSYNAGVLSGTAAEVNTYNFAITATDSLGTEQVLNYTLVTAESSGFTDDDPDEPVSGVSVDCRTADGVVRSRTCNLITDSSTTVTWTDSWYYIAPNTTVTLSAGAIVSGKVSLILGDGATLTVNGASNKAGIGVTPENVLTIYCQSAGTGKLITTGGTESAGIGGDDNGGSCGKVTIYGGDIIAIGGSYAAGIGGGDDHGNGGTVAIYGGSVRADGGSLAAGIGGGWSPSTGDGTLTVGENVVVKAGSSSSPTTELEHGVNGAIAIVHSSHRYFLIETTGPVPLSQTTSAFTAYVGDAFTATLADTVSGGTSPYTFVQKSGTLPTGLSFANGVVSGTPTVAASADVVFTVTDSGTGADAQSEDFTYSFTVTAKPKKITYYNGAVEITGLTPTNYVEGTATTLAPTAPAATGYEFAGWYGNSGLTGDPVSAIPAVATGDQEFWAKWKLIEYTITYMDGATPMTGLTPTNYTIEAAATLPATATKAGYGFYGWYTNSTFTGSEATAIPVGSTGNKTFYAKWGVQRLSTAYVNAAGVAMPNEDCIPISSGTSELEDGWYVVNGEVTADSPITVSGDVNVILADGARLSVTGSQYGAAINVAAGNSLTIYCQSGRTGRLEATATSGIAAVIGSGNNQNGGAITINGGVVVATGSGSGIGSGFGGTCGTITINGGEVTAQGGSSGAGIGSCMNGVAGTVIINGGTVTATSDGQAGIGGGYNVAGGTVTINGGTVTATGGSSTPGIGAGNGSSDHGSLTVGANVVVKAGANANPTEVINPNGETDLSSLLTGQRYFTAETVGDAPLAQRTGAIAASENTAFEISLATTISGGRPPYEFSGTGPGELGLTLASDGTLSGTLAAGTYNFSVNVSDAESADITANYTLTVAYTTKLIYYFDGGTRIVGHEPSTYVPGEVVVLVPYEKEGYTFDGWYLDGEFLNGPYASISALETTSKTFFGKWTKNDAPEPQGDGVNVTFINAEGISQTTNCVGLTTEITTLADGGWYVVTNALNYGGSGITVAGTANLVIADDASLTVGGTSFYAGITLPAGTTLNVFGQANGSGTLTATGNYGAGIGGGYADLVGAMGGAASCGTLVVNGGNVTAIGGMESAGIGGGYHGAGGTFVVNRGTVTATGGNNGAGIGGGNSSAGGTVTVNGGSVTATGGSMGAGIGGGSGAIGGTVVVNGGTVTATGGMSNSYGIGAGAGIDLNPGTLKIAPALAAKAGAAANPQTEFYADGDGYVTFGSAYQYCTVTASGAIPYIDADGTEKAARCRAISSSVYQRVVLDEEWYVVEGDVTVQRGMSVSGNVKLILVDGASLTVTQDHDSWAGISVTNGNSLTIYGQSAQSGVLTVTGGYNAAGIGGDNAIACGTITINGGVITAQGGQSGAGMGGGKNGNGGTVVVNRGTVTVTGGSSGAGIGGGESGSAGTVTINGGTVTANGGEFASAIGGGLSGNGGSVTVNGGSVSAVGGDYGGTAIGKGMSGSDNGTLTVAARVLVKSGTASDNLTIVNPTVVAATLVPDGKRYSSIVPAVVCPIAYVDDDGVTQLENIEPAHYVVGVGATLPATATKTGCVFDGWYASSALSGDPVTEISASAEGAQIVYAKWIYASMVSFVDASGQEHEEYCRRLTALSERTLSTGWYYVDGDVTLDSSLVVNGAVTLVLFDDAKLTVQGAASKAGINVTGGNSLTVYAQESGTGKLLATGGNYGAGIGGDDSYSGVANCGAITVNGGMVVAKGGQSAAGIGGGDGGSGGTVTVNGGIVLATGSSSPYVVPGVGAGHNGANMGTLTVADGVSVGAGQYLVDHDQSIAKKTPVNGVVELAANAVNYEFEQTTIANAYGYVEFSSDEPFSVSVTKRWDKILKYSTNAETWDYWFGSEINAVLSQGRYRIYFRGIGNTKLSSDGDSWVITGSNVSCEGNIEVMRDYAGIATLANGAYFDMFKNCSALVRAPTLPATVMTQNCYKRMFSGCVSLTTPPALPATTLAANCYQEMFSGCTSLDTLPALPATELVSNCYNQMFQGCTALKIYDTDNGECVEWSIPQGATGTSWGSWMFYGTTGYFATRTTEPTIGTTYYYLPPAQTEYSITYMDGAEEMTGLTPATYLTGEGATLPTASTVTKPGWLFIGWHVSSDCTDPAVLTIAVNATGDKTFYADWEELGEPEFTIVNGTLTAVNLRGNTAIMIPDEVYDINMQVFTNCTYLESVMIPTTVTNIGYAAFQGCSALTELTIPGSVEAIGQSAFWGCTSLTNLTLVDGVKYIGNYAFWGCSSLTNGVAGLYFPDSVESIGTDAFESCGHLTKVSLPGAMYVAGAPNHPAFNHVITEVTYRVLEPVFHVDGNNTLQSVELNGFTEITIPSTVRAIAAGALADAVSLESVTIPSSVTNIKVRAFAGCTGLTSVTMAEGPVAIGAQAFYGCTGLTRVTIPDSVTTLEDGVFWGCTSLSGVTVGSGVTQIDELTFQGCTSLSSVTFRGNVTHIGTHAFAGCSNLSNQTFPDSLEDIATDAFKECVSIKMVTIPAGVLIHSFAFRDCTDLKNVKVGKGCTIEPWAFYGCTRVKSVSIGRNKVPLLQQARLLAAAPQLLTADPDACTIGSYAFFGCGDLDEVELGSTVENIGGGAFAGCPKLTTIDIEEGNDSYKVEGGMLLTKDGSALVCAFGAETSMAVPSGVVTVATGAFAGYATLSNVTLSASVVTIGEAAFSNCTVLATATIQSNVTSIAANAFYGTALATVYVSKGDTSHIRGLVQGSGYSSPVTYIELGDEPVVTEDWPENPASVEGQTAAAAFGVTGELANAKADDLATWAKAKGVDYTNRETIIPDAFLLNCANTAAAVATATEDAEEAIKITAITIVNGVPQLTYPATYGNGQVVLRGSATVGASASWHDGKQTTDRFFKTILRLKLP